MNNRSNGISRRNKTLLLAAAGLLLVLIIGGAWLANRPVPSEEVTSALPGEALIATLPPGENETQPTAAPPGANETQPGELLTTPFAPVENETQPGAAMDQAAVANLAPGYTVPVGTQPMVFLVGDGQMCLVYTNEWLGQTGKYMVRLWQCDAKPESTPANERWELAGNATDGYQVRSSDLCLDVEGATMAAGATVTTFPCNGSSTNQRWELLATGDLDKVKLKSKLSGLCLSLVKDQNYFVQQDCATQAWEPTVFPFWQMPAEKVMVPGMTTGHEGLTYFIRPVFSERLLTGPWISLYSWQNIDHFLWTPTLAADGMSFRFTTPFANTCLSTPPGSRNSGAEVPGKCNFEADLWRLSSTEDYIGKGYFQIHNKSNFLCLDVRDWRNGGRRVILSTCNIGEPGQWWTFKYATK